MLLTTRWDERMERLLAIGFVPFALLVTLIPDSFHDELEIKVRMNTIRMDQESKKNKRTIFTLIRRMHQKRGQHIRMKVSKYHTCVKELSCQGLFSMERTESQNGSVRTLSLSLSPSLFSPSPLMRKIRDFESVSEREEMKRKRREVKGKREK